MGERRSTQSFNLGSYIPSLLPYSVGIEPLSPAYILREGITYGHECQEVEVIEGHLRGSLPPIYFN